MSGISVPKQRLLEARLRQCMDERGTHAAGFRTRIKPAVSTKFHQKDVSEWLNTGNRTSSELRNRVSQI